MSEPGRVERHQMTIELLDAIALQLAGGGQRLIETRGAAFVHEKHRPVHRASHRRCEE